MKGGNDTLSDLPKRVQGSDRRALENMDIDAGMHAAYFAISFKE